jgi:hypothetical protein
VQGTNAPIRTACDHVIFDVYVGPFAADTSPSSSEHQTAERLVSLGGSRGRRMFGDDSCHGLGENYRRGLPFHVGVLGTVIDSLTPRIGGSLGCDEEADSGPAITFRHSPEWALHEVHTLRLFDPTVLTPVWTLLWPRGAILSGSAELTEHLCTILSRASVSYMSYSCQGVRDRNPEYCEMARHRTAQLGLMSRA